MQFIIRYTDPTGKWVVEEFGTDIWRATARQIALGAERACRIEAGDEAVNGFPYLEIEGGSSNEPSNQSPV